MSRFASKYSVPKHLTTAFSPAEVKELEETFQTFDASGDGLIDEGELVDMIARLGKDLIIVMR